MTSNSAFWDGIAERYAAKPIKDPGAYEETLSHVRSYLSGNDEVLEIGCGSGTTALNLAPDVHYYTATDFSKNMVALAERKLAASAIDNLTFVATDVFDSAFQEEAYDAVNAFHVLHLLPDPIAALRRIHALLKPEGLLFSKTVCLGGYKWFIPPLISVMQFFGRAPYVNLLTVQDLDGLIRSSGFDILETGLYPAAPPSRFVVAKKSGDLRPA